MSIEVAKPDLAALMPNNAQFVIPLYQRPYEWDMKNWKELWEDLASAYERRRTNPTYTHFFGPVVTINFTPLIPQPDTQQHLVDGQQRLTTITLLAKALFDVLGQEADLDYRNAMRGLFVNASENIAHRAKVMPGRHDRDGYLSLMEIAPLTDLPDGAFVRAYRFFKNKVSEWMLEWPNESRKVETHRLFMTLAQGFRLVQIALGPGESCYEIFDSLNRKGTELQPADEVRNYCFMLLQVRPEAIVQGVYDQHWHPMEQNMLTPGTGGNLSENLSEFLRAWGTMRLGEQFAVRNLAAYLSGKVIEPRAKEFAVSTGGPGSEASPVQLANAADEFISEVHSYSADFQRMKWPQTISSPGEHAVRSRIERAQSFGVAGAADPLMLLLMHSYAGQPGNMDGFIKCLQILESYVIRRALSGISGKQNNRVFAGLAHNLYELVHQPNAVTMMELAARLQTLLIDKSSDSDDRWPTDAEVREGMFTARVYKDRRALVKDVLISVELATEGHTQTTFASFEVEHIMPKDLTEEWSQDLGGGPGAAHLHERLKNTIGNLVLLTHEENMAAGQKRLGEKRTVYANSSLRTTQWICNFNTWREADVRQRSDWLCDRIRQLWPRPIVL